ncbi:uncharacterized protein KQ657_001656 [Scheffersomyces spartinae]|uniref:Uncharacterized protein n=1 Tax=Scheffersomyces spartinae TaxID=45513 RepID=A0A9P7V7E3_9ASCO|nr:uncharacterized protein KQ657_001656 [Scheffersomyces spartinae]KAG7192557.1 hypothetical protein KQ657_001656 [Scheffersomyces spartinae]
MPDINASASAGGSAIVGSGESASTEDSEANLIRLRQQYLEKLRRLRAESLRRTNDSNNTRDKYENLARDSNLSPGGLGEHWKGLGVVIDHEEDDDDDKDSNKKKVDLKPGSPSQKAEAFFSSRNPDNHVAEEAVRTFSSDDTHSNRELISYESFRFKRHSPRINYLYLEATRYQYLNAYLKPNAKYVGEQRSGRERYRIIVEFQLIDWQNLVVTGFLHITGLTEDHPEITTCFTGEIINNPFFDAEALRTGDHHDYGSSTSSASAYFSTMNKSYSFLTENKSWGSYPRNDLEHWRRLTNCQHQVSDTVFKKELSNIIKGKLKQGVIYMRWKEEFLLPDSRIKSIRGASFEGFYYIALNTGLGGTSHVHKSSRADFPFPDGINNFVDQSGTITGLYYHKTSEKFQSLFLKYVEDYGSSGRFDFA